MLVTGYVRKVDHLGRLVIPKRLRKDLAISNHDPIEIYVEGDSVVLSKYQPKCVFCGEPADKIVWEKPICETCMHELNVVGRELAYQRAN